MKTKCVTNRSGYENVLTIGKEYEVVDVCTGIFAGDHYITVDIGGGKTASALKHRFDISKEEIKSFMEKSLTE